MNQIRRVAVESARAGADVALDRFRTDISVDTKDDKTDVVTEADQLAQERIIDRIQSTFPDATIISEELDDIPDLTDDGMTWIIDPIDGTHNYVRGNRRWTTSVTCIEDNEVQAVANLLPAFEDAYVGTPDEVLRNGTPVSVSTHQDPDQFLVSPIIWWPRDRRDEYATVVTRIVTEFGDLIRLRSTQAALSMLAAGELDGAVTNVFANSWDTVGGVALIRWAGGTVTDVDGRYWTPDSRGVIASNGHNHDELLSVVSDLRGQSQFS